jgi:hypothetical protein
VGRDRPERVVLATMPVVAVALALVPVAHSVAAGLALFAAAGVGIGPQASAAFAVRDRHAPAGARTQVFTVAAGVKLSAGAVGAALAGQLAHAGPYPLIMAAAGVQLVAAAVGALLLRRRVRARGARGAVAVGAQ